MTQTPAPPATAALIQALARGQSLDALRDPQQRADLLELLCERDLLAIDEACGYRFKVPLIQRWIADQRRLPLGAEARGG